MKLNPDCIRDILLEVEKQPFEKILHFEDLQNQLPKYTYEDLTYTCLKLKEGGLIKIAIISADNHTHVEFIQDLTFDGHEFLNNIRADNVWNHVKTVGSKIGASSVSALCQIAAQVISAIIKQEIGLQ